MSLKFLTAKALATGAALAISAGGAAVAANVVLPATAPVVFGAVAAPGNAALVNVGSGGDSSTPTPVAEVVIPEVPAPSPEVSDSDQNATSRLSGSTGVDQLVDPTPPPTVPEPPVTTVPPVVTPTTRVHFGEHEHQSEGDDEHSYHEESEDD